jgi:hypothetical protein
VHRGAWWVKLPFWGACIVLAFLLPPSFASVYFEVARIGGGVFLLIQLVILLGSVYEMVGTYPKCHAQMLAKVPKMPPKYPK